MISSLRLTTVYYLTVSGGCEWGIDKPQGVRERTIWGSHQMGRASTPEMKPPA